MTDRSLSGQTMIAVGKNTLAVPRFIKRLLEAAVAAGLTALVALVFITISSMLMGARGGYMQGVDAWYAFIRRPDILATMVLTAFVTITYGVWQNRNDRR